MDWHILAGGNGGRLRIQPRLVNGPISRGAKLKLRNRIDATARYNSGSKGFSAADFSGWEELADDWESERWRGMGVFLLLPPDKSEIPSPIDNEIERWLAFGWALDVYGG